MSLTNIKKAKKHTHGMTKTPTWNSWKSMHERCSNAKHFAYKDYGGRRDSCL